MTTSTKADGTVVSLPESGAGCPTWLWSALETGDAPVISAGGPSFGMLQPDERLIALLSELFAAVLPSMAVDTSCCVSCISVIDCSWSALILDFLAVR